MVPKTPRTVLCHGVKLPLPSVNCLELVFRNFPLPFPFLIVVFFFNTVKICCFTVQCHGGEWNGLSSSAHPQHPKSLVSVGLKNSGDFCDFGV